MGSVVVQSRLCFRVIGTASAAVVLSLAACGVNPPGPTPRDTQPSMTEAQPSDDGTASAKPTPAVEVDPADLVGVWHWPLTGVDHLWSYAADGRWWADPGGNLAHDPDYAGTWELNGNEVSLIYTSAPEECAGKSHIGLLITNVDDGRIAYEVTEWECYPGAVGATDEYVRFSPNNVFQHVVPSPPEETIGPPTTANARGDWHFVGTSTLLELAVDLNGGGNYWWDSEGELAWSPQDTGTVGFTDDGFVLTSQDSEICDAGSRFVLHDSEIYSPPLGTTAFFVITGSVDDECGRMSGDVTLMLVSF